MPAEFSKGSSSPQTLLLQVQFILPMQLLQAPIREVRLPSVSMARNPEAPKDYAGPCSLGAPPAVEPPGPWRPASQAEITVQWRATAMGSTKIMLTSSTRAFLPRIEHLGGGQKGKRTR